MAITFDDLPWHGPTVGPEERIERTGQLLGTLRARNVEATGFVNCDRAPDGEPVLRLWLEAGMELGNHSASHPDINRTPPDQWLEDVRRCDKKLRALSENVRYFRFPMLHQGSEPEIRDRAAGQLADWGYETAHVTIDNSEWLLARAYDGLVEIGDSLAMAALGELYVDHLVDAARHFRAVSQERLGRDIAHVLLLHANRIAADHVGAALDAIGREGFHFVTLQEALSDPAYDFQDGYVGPKGLSWLYRMAPSRPELAAWDDETQTRIRAGITVLTR